MSTEQDEFYGLLSTYYQPSWIADCARFRGRGHCCAASCDVQTSDAGCSAGGNRYRSAGDGIHYERSNFFEGRGVRKRLCWINSSEPQNSTWARNEGTRTGPRSRL